MRAWFCGGLGALLVACGNPQNNANVPDQPSNPDETPVIVLGRPTPKTGQTNEPLTVAREEPELAVATTPEPTNRRDIDLAALVRDPRKITLAPRPRAMLVTEIQGLEALQGVTPPNAPDRPRLVRRLAENYVELKNSAMRDKQRLLRSPAAPRDELVKLDTLTTAARNAAIKYFQMMVKDHPTFCQLPNATDPAQSQGCLDEIHYFLGLEMLQIDKPDEARKQFLSLIKNFPQSKWIPHAYLVFGEMFVADAAADPTKLEYARQAYEKILQFPPPQNDTYGFAHYRLGQVHVQRGDYQNALTSLTKAADFASSYAVLPSSEALDEAVRREIIPVYAAIGTPRKAEAYFKHVAHDPPGSNERLVGMLDALVRIYLRDKKRVEASDLCYAFSGGVNGLPSCQVIAPPGSP